MIKVLFFSPHSFIWQHAYPEALIAEALKSEGATIHYVTCGRALKSRCVAMDSIGESKKISEEKKTTICSSCEVNKEQLLRHFNFENSNLSDYLENNQQIQIIDILESIRPDTIFEFEIDGLPVGRASLYNFTLNQKKSFKYDFNDEEWDSFLDYFESTLVSFYAGKNLLVAHRPDRIIFYSSAYSANLVVRMQAEKLGIPCFSIFAGSNWFNRLQRMYIAKTDSFAGFIERLSLWNSHYSFLPSSYKALLSAFEHHKALLTSKNIMIYGGGNSKIDPTDLRKRWGIPHNKKILFMATSSSDEVSAAQTIGALTTTPKMAFKDQIEWIKCVIDYVSKHEDLSLVIRIHPREFPNSREIIGSDHSLKLKELLTNLPSNVVVNWPWDGVSLNDWIEIIDVGLTSWSSVGRDFALWGIPNLSFSNELSFYPKNELGYVGDTQETYFNQLELALKEGWNQDRILTAYRWLAYEMEGAVFDLSDAVPQILLSEKSFYQKAFDKITRYKFEHSRWFRKHKTPLDQAPLIYNRINSMLPSEHILSENLIRLEGNEEFEEIKSIARRICEIKFGPEWHTFYTRSSLLSNLHHFLKN
jgi:hypothetical protein